MKNGKIVPPHTPSSPIAHSISFFHFLPQSFHFPFPFSLYYYCFITLKHTSLLLHYLSSLLQYLSSLHSVSSEHPISLVTSKSRILDSCLCEVIYMRLLLLTLNPTLIRCQKKNFSMRWIWIWIFPFSTLQIAHIAQPTPNVQTKCLLMTARLLTVLRLH